jgi:hypothetical protein
MASIMEGDGLAGCTRMTFAAQALAEHKSPANKTMLMAFRGKTAPFTD